jgi:hypothetical protein
MRPQPQARTARPSHTAAGETTPKRPYHNRVGVLLAITPLEYASLKQCARQDGLPFATWIRHLAMREMRRMKAEAK